MAEGISIVWDGVSEFRDRIDAMIKKADEAARIVVTDGGHLIERRAKQYAPVQTGTLRRSIHVNSVAKLGPGKYQSLTGPTLIYARMREFGGTIRARNAPYLKFQIGGKNGNWVQVKSVTQKGTHYMQRAFDESVPALQELYKATFREALES